MNYLKYIELAAENLQFYLWLRNYTKRFEELRENEKALSPEWLPEHESETPVQRPKVFDADTTAVFQGTAFASDPKIADVEKSNPFFTPPRTPNTDAMHNDAESVDSFDASMMTDGKVDHAVRATDAFESAGLKWKPRKSCFFDLA